MRHCRLNQEWLVDVNAGKTQLVLFDWSHNSGATDVTMDGPIFEEKSSFTMLRLPFCSTLDWRKLEP